MRADPRPFVRPVLVCAGFFDPGPAASHVRRVLESVTTTPERVIEVPFLSCRTFESCRRRVTGKLASRFPSSDPEATVEVDAIGISMGGVVARYAALPTVEGAGPRLSLVRLFTIGSPHRGARYAYLGFFDARARDMKPGSAFLERLNLAAPEASYTVVPYVRLGDVTVGETNSVWLDGHVWWVPNRPFELPHGQAFGDPRLLADIARRLRGEPPLTIEPPAPLPEPAVAH